jgi:hypothetical protein
MWSEKGFLAKEFRERNSAQTAAMFQRRAWPRE